MATDTDKAYAAGIIDGEGHVAVRYRSKRNSMFIKVRVSQVDPEVCIWLRETFGGPVSCRPALHCRKKVLFTWELSCRKAADFLEMVLPYLKIKKIRAEAAIKLARLSRRVGNIMGHRYIQPLGEDDKRDRMELAQLIRLENQRISS